MFENQGDVEIASRLTTNALDERIADVPELQPIDVRNPGEAEAGMIGNAVNIPVGNCRTPGRVGRHSPTVVYCAGDFTGPRWRPAVAQAWFRRRQ